MKRFQLFFTVVICIAMIASTSSNAFCADKVKQDIFKQIKKAIKDGKALKPMKELAIISVWSIDWVTRGAACPGDIQYAQNIETHRSWTPRILSNFQPCLVSGLKSAYSKTGQILKPISYAVENPDYKSFTPTQTEPKKGRGRLLGTLDGLHFIDDNADDIAAASKSLDVDGVITIRYTLAPSLLPLKKNKIKIWMKIFTKDGNLVWFGKMYGEFKGAPPKLRDFNSLIKLVPKGEKAAMDNMATLYRKSFKKAK
ncbi:MAG: hypothetical protein KAU06_06130 [Candidatus Marinimicrobia bacterium]|nr:hypothetical protein [Candidatus Neomarinimicrobiota bacterium]